MEPIVFTLTQAGLAALVAAESSGTAAISIAEVGLSPDAFDPAPTLVALPGEIKRLPIAGGTAPGPNLLHLTAQDATGATYQLRGLGLYLADGTLFAAYSQAEPIFAKVSIASFLLALDIGFDQAIDAVFAFGDATFLYPPATEETKGVARIATQARVDAAEDAGDDAETIVTPKTLRARLASLVSAIFGRQIIGGGLVTGGGDLSQDRELRVEPASAADLRAGTSSEVAVTPATLGPIDASLTPGGWARLPGGLIIQWGIAALAAGEYTRTATLPLTFPNANLVAFGSYASNPSAGDDDEGDENLWVSVAGPGAVSIHGSGVDDYSARQVAYLAIGF